LNHDAMFLVAARAGINWARGIFHALKRPILPVFGFNRA
jgi:hypothetical protein